jgi:hypothetical protein
VIFAPDQVFAAKLIFAIAVAVFIGTWGWWAISNYLTTNHSSESQPHRGGDVTITGGKGGADGRGGDVTIKSGDAK